MRRKRKLPEPRAIIGSGYASGDKDLSKVKIPEAAGVIVLSAVKKGARRPNKGSPQNGAKK